MKRVNWFVLASLTMVAAAAPTRDRAQLPWYMQETAMTADGRLTFLDKPWWPRAKGLAEGASFQLDLNGDGRPDTLIERKDGNIIEVIDDTGRAESILNQASSAYVVSLKGTGIVDRLIAYIDNDGDGKADEMEIRYFEDGYLRWAWFGENHDPDGAQIFTLKNWSYDGNGSFESKFRGNVENYVNKYDQKTGTWTPLSECPFSWWDPNHDGRAEVVLRASAAPLSSNTGKDADYANHLEHALAPDATPLDQMGSMNERFSFNIDPEPRTEPLTKPHFNFGFTMVGQQSYNYPQMFDTNLRRRPPQTVVRMPWQEGIAYAMHYPAQQTGFSWDEARNVWRWEGEFWIFERAYMPNTGGPTMRWNIRREYSPKSSTERKLYYSDVDKRYHLFGAKNGWLEVGHLINQRKDLEFRYFDSTGGGYFDTFEVLEGSNPVPVRISRVGDPRSKPVEMDREFLEKDYNGRVLPEAIAEDQRLIAILKGMAESPLAVSYEEEAGKSKMAERKRYCLDVARELYFLKVRDGFYQKAAVLPYATLEKSAQQIRSPRFLDLGKGPVDGGYTVGDSVQYWAVSNEIEEFVDNYGAGKLDEAGRLAGQIANALK